MTSLTPPSPVSDSSGAALNGRQRLLRALRGQPADRVPGWIMRQAGRYLPEYNEIRRHYDFLTLCKTPAAAAEVSLQPLKAIGAEAVIVFNDILIPLERAGARLEYDDHGPLLRDPIRRAADLRALPSSCDFTPGEPVAQTIAEARRRAGDEVPILGFIGSPWTLAAYWVEGRVTDRRFDALEALRRDDPALLEALLERLTALALQYLNIQIAAGADAVQIFDTWGTLLAPGDYARWSGRWLRQIIDAVRQAAPKRRAPLIVYVNDCRPHLEELGRLGADCLSIDWRLELSEARQSLGPGIALQGNLDPQVLLSEPGVAAQAVRALFEKFPPGPGHVFNLGHGIPPTASPASARAVLEAVRQYGVY